MTDQFLLMAIRHSCWANAELIRFCMKLSPEQMGWTAPGTYGTVQLTLQHTVRAEEGYLAALTGIEPQGGRIDDVEHAVPLDEVLRRAQDDLARMEAFLASGPDPLRMHARPNGDLASARLLVAQFVHHGSDHRAHVGTILGSHGLEPPDLDVWSYAHTIGDLKEAAPA